MTKGNSAINGSSRSMIQATIRIRGDQRMRLEKERRARGGTLADVLRDNLDLAFAVKAELAKIVEGEYDENDPKNAPRLVHTLLFRVEERILGALDTIARKLDVGAYNNSAVAVTKAADTNMGFNQRENYVAELVNGFINLLAEDRSHEPEVWIGAFLEIVPRLELVSEEQLGEIRNRGEQWLEEQGYYPSESETEAGQRNAPKLLSDVQLQNSA